ncbi:MAG: porin family protein [Megasphaera sp.]|nr:porin family protein [Megasphaera sp.]MCH4187585.1 porin family protein [Megasphaera sp.]MCH4217870.1 porin family protein [Megasphaera sp.]
MKKILLAGVLAALMSVSAVSMAAPIKNPQQGDLKANVNYGFDQKEGGRDAGSRFSGGDVTYVINDNLDLQYVNNYTKGDNNNKINENYVIGNYRLTKYVSAFAGGSYVKTDTYNNQHSWGYQVGLKGQLPIAEKWQGFASVGVGDDVNSYEVGVGYDITPNWDAHVKYRRADVSVDNYDDTVKGWQVGMGYKF